MYNTGGSYPRGGTGIFKREEKKLCEDTRTGVRGVKGVACWEQAYD